MATSLYHLDKASQDHILDGNSVAVCHDMFERFEEVFLELETGQFLDFHESH